MPIDKEARRGIFDVASEMSAQTEQKKRFSKEGAEEKIEFNVKKDDWESR